MAGKAPVIMSMPVGEATSIVKRHNCGVVCEPDSPKKLAECIEDLFNNQDKVTEYGNNGYKAVIEKYNRGKLASKYFEVIEAV